MKFLCLICAEKVMEQMPEADAERRFEEYRKFTEAIRKSGHFIGVNRLLPPDAAATVRVRQGKVSITDGPYAETKAQLGGYYIIEAGDLNEAIRWPQGFRGHGADASKCGRLPRTNQRCGRSGLWDGLRHRAPDKAAHARRHAAADTPDLTFPRA